MSYYIKLKFVNFKKLQVWKLKKLYFKIKFHAYILTKIKI